MFGLALGFITFFYPILGEGALPDPRVLQAACSTPTHSWSCPAARYSGLATHQSFGEYESENKFSKRKALRTGDVVGFLTVAPVLPLEDAALPHNFQAFQHHPESNRAPPSL